jgi:hypothetical protein
MGQGETTRNISILGDALTLPAGKYKGNANARGVLFEP